MGRTIRYSITYNNTTRCSGGCLYCIAATNFNYSMGTSLENENAIIRDCIRVDEQNYNTFNADFVALEKLLDNDCRMKNKKPDDTLSFDIWGADPVTCFNCLQDTVGFIEEYCKERNYKYRISSSTNGLPLLRDEVCDYIRGHNIHIQLSHDGIGQWIRTKNIDPLDFMNVRALMREGLLTAINATLSFWNYSLWENIDYFNGKLKEIFPEVWSKDEMASEELSRVYRSLFIKLNHIMDGQYDVKAKHKDYDVPLGDMSLHNDYELAQKTGNYEFAHVLDNYIQEWDMYFEKYRNNKHNTLELMPFNAYLSSQLKRGMKLKDFNSKGNSCRNYQIGIVDYSEHVDTTGRYSQCNLQDADHPVLNPTNIRENICEECKTCKYRLSSECNMCGALLPRKHCEYFYRWNQFLDKTRNTVRRKGHGKPNTNSRGTAENCDNKH